MVAPDWSRLSVLAPNPERLFLVDRFNGRWALLDQRSAPLVKLLNAKDEQLPEAILQRRNALAWELAEAGLGHQEYQTPGDLNTIILKLTKACNYACSYCYDLEPEDELQHLSLDLAMQVIAEALELAPRKLGIILHGGEPTLLFDRLLRDLVLASEALAESMTKEVIFVGQTNLSRLTREMVEFFQAHDIRWGVSLDGPPEINDRFRVLRNGRGTYTYFAKALEQFPDFVRGCGVLSTVTSCNDSRLLEVARHFRDCGISSWEWSLFNPIGQGRLQADRFGFSLDHLLDSWEDLFEAVEAGEFDGMAIHPVASYLQNLFLGPGRNMCHKKDCGAARDLLSISANGTIEACDCIDRREPYAQLGLVQIGSKGALAAARSSAPAEVIRSRDVTAGKCGTCPWLTLCGGTCLAHGRELHGVWEVQCRLAMLAFARIVDSLAKSDALKRYWRSIQPRDQVPILQSDFPSHTDAAAA